MLTSAVLRMVGFCTRHPWPVIAIAAALMICSALYTATHFAITTDTDQLLPEDLPWRQHELAYREEFPQDQILAVVQGPTPELVEIAPTGWRRNFGHGTTAFPRSAIRTASSRSAAPCCFFPSIA